MRPSANEFPPTNRTLALLKAGQTAVGVVTGLAAPELVEVAARAGIDFVTIDAEHEPIDDSHIAHLVRAAEVYGVTPIVRLASDPARILRLLNAGAQGIQVPRCSSVELAMALVDATRFFPIGQRTFYNLGRSGGYSAGEADSAWATRANNELLVVAMVEDITAIRRISEIAGLVGIDAIHIGPKDLWQSMGMPEQEDVDTEIERIAKAARSAAKFVSMQVRFDQQGELNVKRCVDRGVTMISVPLLDFIRQGAQRLVQDVRAVTGAR